eukprot:Amastigsp_a680166_11.p4 type:complete len:129 gc:universal Amastigsp_a680166_11:482-868(+)
MFSETRSSKTSATAATSWRARISWNCRVTSASNTFEIFETLTCAWASLRSSSVSFSSCAASPWLRDCFLATSWIERSTARFLFSDRHTARCASARSSTSFLMCAVSLSTASTLPASSESHVLSSPERF